VTQRAVRTYPDTYVDSTLLMTATRRMTGAPGVEWAAAVMGTPANLDDLRAGGFDLPPARANDLVLAVRAGTSAEADEALESGHAELADAHADADAGRSGQAVTPSVDRPRTLEDALPALPDGGGNLAIVSVPGPYAALEAHKALSAGLHVLLFSDNVALDDEIELKERGVRFGRLVMGPGAGTAMLGGVGLGFANAVRRGRIGVVAAAGTGAQEVMCLTHRWGEGVSEAIGVGGRDLSAPVGAAMSRLALSTLGADPATELILLVSKPPSAGVASRLLADTPVGAPAKPLVACLVGLDEPIPAPPGVALTGTLEEAVIAALKALGVAAPDPAEGLESSVAASLEGLDAGRSAVLGLFSGGTLAYESMVVMRPHLGPIHSNTPLDKAWTLDAAGPGAHVCLDLGEEEFTRGRPHPMIDPGDRAARVSEAAGDGSIAVILIDVVLGFGGHPDPASVLGPACRDATRQPGGPRVVAYVLGTEEDPQVRSRQCRALEDAGCMLAPTAARAALMAAALATRRPSLAGLPPGLRGA
jgi:FdrA protein